VNSNIKLTYSSPTDPLFKKGVINTIEAVSGRQKVKKLYEELENEGLNGVELWKGIFDKLDIKLDFERSQLLKIPTSGPLIIIANHPFGVVDGLILGKLLAQRRLDFKLIVNEVLTRERMLKPYFLPIDFRNTKKAMHCNIQTRKDSMEFLKNGHALGIFPSGGVATTPKITDKKAEDLEWKRFVIKILLAAKATIVPIFFHGQNSKIFQWASHVHPNIRLALLMHEVTNKMGSTIKIEIHNPITFDELPKDLNKIELLEYLKNRTIS
tara:strand:+ start:1662 stop:2465 length:804 start_codon:yes stop_codon:yes gene_type:complete